MHGIDAIAAEVLTQVVASDDENVRLLALHLVLVPAGSAAIRTRARACRPEVGRPVQHQDQAPDVEGRGSEIAACRQAPQPLLMKPTDRVRQISVTQAASRLPFMNAPVVSTMVAGVSRAPNTYRSLVVSTQRVNPRPLLLA